MVIILILSSQVTDKTTSQKNQDIELNNMINSLDLIYTYKALYPKQ